MGDELANLDATAQADLLRRGELTAAELVEAAIRRIEALNPKLNAVICPLFEKARDQVDRGEIGDGPFRGVPFVVKDLILKTKGDRYHAGMKLLKDRDWRAPHDTHLARKFCQAGFVFVGKTNVPEMGPMPTTEPAAYGPTRNPWNTDHSPGGSSGGTAAAVASGMVPVGHGNDGGGSIRIPSSECGLVGLKPSRGRNSLGPDYGDMWAGMVAEHVLSRSVRDTAAILDQTAGEMPGDRTVAPPPARPFLEEVGAPTGTLRIGLLTKVPNGSVEVHPDCVVAAEETARLLESIGHHVEENHPSALGTQLFSDAIGVVVSSWGAYDLADWERQLGVKIGPGDVEGYNWTVAEMGRGVAGADYVAAELTLQSESRKITQWWDDGFDLLLTPTIVEPPPLLGHFAPSEKDPFQPLMRALALCSFCQPFNVTGQPAISLPLHWNNAGLPIGVQLVAAYGREDLLIRVAAELEQARPWMNRVPPHHA